MDMGMGTHTAITDLIRTTAIIQGRHSTGPTGTAIIATATIVIIGTIISTKLTEIRNPLELARKQFRASFFFWLNSVA
jgi:hypothetical protein